MHVPDQAKQSIYGTAQFKCYLVLTIVLVCFCAGFHDSTWKGSTTLHTIMEVIATLLALMVGLLALVRYYSFKEVLYLYIGAGFIGTGLLDCYHAIVTSVFFVQFFPSPPASLISWSWVASRLSLSIVFFLGWLNWRFDFLKGKSALSKEVSVYLGMGVLTLASFVFFAFVPLPRAYYSELFFQRPEELIPAIFFIVALYGFFTKGEWRHDLFEHWLIYALIINVLTQTLFMSHSSELFDFQFDIAHFFKKISYMTVLIGLLVSMFVTFQREDEHRTALIQINNSLLESTVALKDSEHRASAILSNAVEGILTIDLKGTVLSINPAAELMFGYSAEEVIGKNVKILMPQSYREKHDEYLDNYKRTGIKKIIGMGREVEGECKNGSRFPLDLAVSEVVLDAEEKFYMGIVRDLSEKKQAEKMKNEFLSTVSHELRTPLTSIHCSLGLIIDNFSDDLPDKLMALHTIAYSNSERLIKLINDILDVQKMEMGGMVFDNEAINLFSLLKQSVLANQAYAEKLGNIALQITPENSSVEVYADAGRLMQVITNLISNAVKFSPESSLVNINLVEEESVVRVVITDKGEGIPDDFKDRIFTKFAQADSSDTRKVEGTGLGLSICKIIIERLEGNLDYNNLDEGGCAFYFTLPIYSQPSQTNTSFDADVLNSLEAVSTPHILICEDDPDIASFLQIMLEMEGWTSDVALNAREAKTLLQKRAYSVMTLDVGLPDQDGISFIKEIRSFAAYADLPIIMVSGQAKEKKVEFGSTVSVSNWIDKPIDREQLQESIKKAISFNTNNAKANILHVEDDPDIASLVETMLGSFVNIYHASSIEAAKKTFLQRNYDLILLDLMLPDGNGLDLLPLISTKEQSRHKEKTTPIIIFSAYEMDKKIPDEIQSVLIKSRCSNEQLMNVIRSNMNLPN